VVFAGNLSSGHLPQAMGVPTTRARVKRARALVERLIGTTEIRISGTSLHSDGSRGRRDTMGVLQRGDTTGEEQRENDAK
jgi:hypothetical protein